MKVTAERMENCQVSLTVEVEPDELEGSLESAYRRLVGKVSIPGFRKGKAPRPVLEQHVGKGTLLEEALERLIPQLYSQAVEQEKIEPIDEPRIDIEHTDPVVFKAVVPLRPEVELGDYRSIKVDPAPVEVGDKEVEEALERVREGQAVWNPVDRPVALGDLITADFEAIIDDRPLLDHKDMVYEVRGDSKWPLPGVAQGLVGAVKGEAWAFDVEIPADYGLDEFVGKKCSFKVTPKEIKEKELPEVNDEFAHVLDCDNLVAMKEKVAADLKEMAEARLNQELKQKALDAMVELSKVNYPPVVEDKEIGNLIREEMQRMGFNNANDYFERVGKKREEYVEQLRPVARERINHTLILDKLAEAEKIEVAADELEERMEEIVKRSEDKEKARQLVALPQIKEGVEQSLRTQKTLDMLVDIATGKIEERVEQEQEKDVEEIAKEVEPE
jgi:trigger factor